MKTDNSRSLAYRKRSDQLSKYLHSEKVKKALHQLHNVHRHFAERITAQKTIEKVYWPTYSKNIYKYCRFCVNCQMLESLWSTKKLLSILQLQPLNLLNINYIGSFTSITQSGTQYIIITVDYFSHFLFIKVVFTAWSANSLKFLMWSITDIFEWLWTIYLNNRSHFTKEIFAETLKEKEVQHINAPITHSSSVRFAETYMHLTLSQLRVNLQKSEKAIFS